MGRGAFLHAHLGISKAHSNIKLCMYVYADLCSGGAEAVHKSACSYTPALPIEHKSACS